MPKLGTKKALFGYFGMELENILSYSKSACLNLSYRKIWGKNKNP